MTAEILFGRAILLTLRHALPLLAMTVVVCGPVAWIRWSLIRTVQLGTISSIIPLLTFFASFVAAQGFLSAAIAPFVFHRLGGGPEGLITCLSTGLPRHGRAVLAAVASSLVIHVGFLLYLFPGGYAACLLFVVGPVAVMERKSFLGTFTRSYELLSSIRPEIVLAVVAETILLLFGVAVTMGMKRDLELRGLLWAAIAVLEGMLGLLTLYFAVVQATAYHELVKGEIHGEQRRGPVDPPPFTPPDE